MGRVTDSRALVVAMLEPVLPGRVQPYPADLPAPAAPMIYVDTFDAAWRDDVFWTATFRLRVVADGAGRAAHAQLDELCDAIYDACEDDRACSPDACVFEPFDVDAEHTLPAYTFTVDVDMAANTWCAPDAPTAVPIPVTPIGALNNG